MQLWLHPKLGAGGGGGDANIQITVNNLCICNVFNLCLDTGALSHQIGSKWSDYFRRISVAFWCRVWTAAHVTWSSTQQSRCMWTWDINSEQGSKENKGWPCRDGPWGAIASPTEPSRVSCRHWTPQCTDVSDGGRPLTLKQNKRQWPLFLYHLLAFCPPRPATSALFQDRNGEDREQGAQIQLSPTWPGVLSQQRPALFFLFLCFFLFVILILVLGANSE